MSRGAQDMHSRAHPAGSAPTTTPTNSLCLANHAACSWPSQGHAWTCSRARCPGPVHLELQQPLSTVSSTAPPKKASCRSTRHCQRLEPARPASSVEVIHRQPLAGLKEKCLPCRLACRPRSMGRPPEPCSLNNLEPCALLDAL